MFVSDSIIMVIIVVSIGWCQNRLWYLNSVLVLWLLYGVDIRVIMLNVLREVSMQVVRQMLIVFMVMFLLVIRVISRQFRWVMDEQLSRCLMLFWVSVSRLLKRIEVIVMMFREMFSSWLFRVVGVIWNSCSSMVNIVILLVVVRNVEIGVGVFLQIFGVYRWKGISDSLKFRLISIMFMLMLISGLFSMCLVILVLRLVKFRVLDLVQSRVMLNSRKVELVVESMVYLMLVFSECLLKKVQVIILQIGIESNFRLMNRLVRCCVLISIRLLVVVSSRSRYSFLWLFGQFFMQVWVRVMQVRVEISIRVMQKQVQLFIRISGVILIGVMLRIGSSDSRVRLRLIIERVVVNE